MPEERSSSGIWTENHVVRSYEVDPCGRLSVVSVCNYMQEAASNHAHALGVSIHHLAGQNVTWVLSHLALRIRSCPEWRETIAGPHLAVRDVGPLFPSGLPPHGKE
jgi:hypothetical protein